MRHMMLLSIVLIDFLLKYLTATSLEKYDSQFCRIGQRVFVREVERAKYKYFDKRSSVPWLSDLTLIRDKKQIMKKLE